MLNIRSSIRTRILLLTGTVIILLMLAISFVLLFQWREMIIQNESDNAVSISRTFAVTVIDAMIFEEKSSYKKENILDTYVDNFIARLGTIHYVVIDDRNGSVVVLAAGHPQSDPSRPIIPDNGGGHRQQVRIFEHPEFGWTMEVRQPLVFSGRNWGTATIGFDAQPIRDEIGSVFFLLLTSTFVITLVVLTILFVLINRITSSIEGLVQAIDSIDFTSGGRIEQPRQQDEIGYFFTHYTLLRSRLEASKRDLEKAQQQVYHAEKLASIGRLAAGVAHQVNNPLNGVKSCLYAIRQNHGNTQRVDEYLGLINDGINDIETVVKKLLGFARQQSVSESFIDINEAIRKVINLFELRLKEKNVVVRMELTEPLEEVRIDYHLFQEVVMNLLLNSYDAIERNGAITIATGPHDGSHIFMEIRDNGAGVTPDDMKKIFEPFFTTKDIGTGTGLGLSVCLGIIESHGGRIDVRSTPDVETAFRIILPLPHENKTADH